jgi:hypothetical protein
MTPDDDGLTSYFNLHWKSQRPAALSTRIGVIEKELKAFYAKVVEIFGIVPSHLNELKELMALLEDKADDKAEKKEIQILSDQRKERDRLAIQEQRLALRSLKRRIAPVALPADPPAHVPLFRAGTPPAAYFAAAPPPVGGVKKEVVPPVKKQRSPVARVEESKAASQSVPVMPAAGPGEEDLGGIDGAEEYAISPSKRRRRKPRSLKQETANSSMTVISPLKARMIPLRMNPLTNRLILSIWRCIID